MSPGLIKKSTTTSFQHVRSHQEEKSIENKGELIDPKPYFTLAEEKLIYELTDNHVQGDVRKVLKSIEKEVWIQKTKVQSQWIKKYPTQIFKQAKRVWEAAILNGDGKAWVYFIFAVCQWLPVNNNLYKKVQNDKGKTTCLFCLDNLAETVEHLLVCPALKSEVDHLQLSAQKVLIDCKFPFASLSRPSWKSRCVEKWTVAASEHLEATWRSKIEQLAWDFVNANEQRLSLGTHQFLCVTRSSIRERS